jgi:hypothetical protein
MTTITPEIRRAIEQAGDTPPTVLDPETNRTYVLIPTEDYRRMVAPDRSSSDVAAMYPFIDEVLGRNGWDDPRMDEYNDYESYRP